MTNNRKEKHIVLSYGEIYCESDFRIWASIKLIGECLIEGYKMVDLGNFPLALETNDKNDIIIVKVYEVPRSTLDLMDKKLKSLFGRKKIASANGIEGWVYYNTIKTTRLKGNAEIIHHGNWEKHLLDKEMKSLKDKKKKRRKIENEQAEEYQKELEQNKTKTN